MDCRNARELLGAYHDGELAGADRDRVAAHLERCAECAALLEALRRIDGAVEAPDPGPAYWEGFQR
ncbi:MAG: anti-sigma factor family protein, partial [Verrucomicrobiota bacterium]